MNSKLKTISGLEFKAHKVRGRALWVTQTEEGELLVGYSDSLHITTNQPLGWYWDYKKTSSRAPVNPTDAYGTYFASAEEAVANALKQE